MQNTNASKEIIKNIFQLIRLVLYKVVTNIVKHLEVKHKCAIFAYINNKYQHYYAVRKIN